MEILVAQNGHSLVVGATAGTSAALRAFILAIGRTTRKNRTAAMIKKLIMVLIKIP